MTWSIPLVAGSLIFIAVAWFIVRWLFFLYRDVREEQAKKRFSAEREHLEAKFFELASSTGKPKGLKWERCDFASPVKLARDKKTGSITAFVEVTIAFSAVEGGGMEHVAAVSNLRSATAVFHFHQGHWGTGGKVLFNMDPAQALELYQNQYEAAGP